MIKTIFFLILKIIGLLLIAVLIISAVLFYRTKGENGYRKGWFGISYFSKQSHESWFFSKKKLKGEHRRSFEVFEEGRAYAKDKNTVYFKGTTLKDSDPATFSTAILFDGPRDLMESFLVRDKKNIYYRENLVSTDAGNFSQVSGRYFKDSKRVFLLKKVEDPQYSNDMYFALIEGANPRTFECLPSSLARDDKDVFYNDKLVKYALRDTITEIDYCWTDGQNVFYHEQVLKEADLSTFEILEHRYSRDHQQIYFRHLALTGLNPEAFRELPQSGYATDGTLVFFEGKKLEGVDYPSFEQINFNHWKDKSHVYFEHERLPDADPNTIQLLKGSRGSFSKYSKDKDAVYHDARKLEGVNPTTFTTKGTGRYGQDKWTDGKKYFNYWGEEI